MGRKRDLPLIESVEITGIGAEGRAVARVDNMVLFVPGMVPGDVADIRVKRKRRRYYEGEMVRLISPSSDRVVPRCSHFGICGGCKWQHMDYSLQLKHKAGQVFETLNRIGGASLTEPPSIAAAPSTYYYRNKLEYTFSSRRWLTREEIDSGQLFDGPGAVGFHIPGYFDKVLDITECHLQSEPSDRIRNGLREYAVREGLTFYDQVRHEGYLRNLIIRTTSTGEVMVILVTGYDDDMLAGGVKGYLERKFPQITSLYHVINDKLNDTIGDRDLHLWSGSSFITEEIDGLSFRISPKAFFQTNSLQAAELYDTVRDFADLRGHELVYDLYCGTGTISCYIARHAGRVVGIEYLEEAVADARVNVSLNAIGNVSFITGDMKDVMSDALFDNSGHPEVIITDPPRAGMHRSVVEAILRAAPRKIVYVSCNPATQARDISLLSDRYEVSGVKAVDMFPQTHHIESVVSLVRVD